MPFSVSCIIFWCMWVAYCSINVDLAMVGEDWWHILSPMEKLEVCWQGSRDCLILYQPSIIGFTHALLHKHDNSLAMLVEIVCNFTRVNQLFLSFSQFSSITLLFLSTNLFSSQLTWGCCSDWPDLAREWWGWQDNLRCKLPTERVDRKT